MLAPADLLALWTALAAAARHPGRTVLLPATARDAPGFSLHPVPTVVVALVAAVRLEQPGRRPIDLAPGEAAVVAAGALHRHAPLRHGAATLELGFEFAWCDLQFRRGEAVLSATRPRQPAEALVERMQRGDEQALAGLLAMVLERPLQQLQPLPAAALRMRDCLRSRGLTPIAAADIARAGGLRPSRAWQLFRRHFGCTPRQALEHRRCAVAAALLDRGLAVAEVARRCGYADRGTFRRAFARQHGRPPGRRRRAP